MVGRAKKPPKKLVRLVTMNHVMEFSKSVLVVVGDWRGLDPLHANPSADYASEPLGQARVEKSPDFNNLLLFGKTPDGISA